MQTNLSLKLACLGMFLFCSAEAFSQGAIARQLTRDGSMKRDPCFIKNGGEIIFCYDETPDLVRMMVMSSKGGEAKPFIKDAGDKHHVEPSFSSDGRYFAYTECTGNLTAQLVIKDTQENKLAYIRHSGRGGTRSSCFSPDSKLLVYAFAETGPQQLWSVKPDGTDKKQLTQSEGISNWPSFTPDGKRVVFTNSRENNYEIYSMNLDGTGEKRLTENKLMDVRPVVSPDGRKIAFTSTRDGNYEIYVMGIDGGVAYRLTHNQERDDYPAWHPDSQKILFVSERLGRFDLFEVDVPPNRILNLNTMNDSLSGSGSTGSGSTGSGATGS